MADRHKSAEDYGTLAASVAAGMRAIDPNVELVVCGSTSHVMDTFASGKKPYLRRRLTTSTSSPAMRTTIRNFSLMAPVT